MLHFISSAKNCRNWFSSWSEDSLLHTVTCRHLHSRLSFWTPGEDMRPESCWRISAIRVWALRLTTAMWQHRRKVASGFWKATRATAETAASRLLFAPLWMMLLKARLSFSEKPIVTELGRNPWRPFLEMESISESVAFLSGNDKLENRFTIISLSFLQCWTSASLWH